MRNFIAAGNEARVISRLYPGRDSDVGCLRRRRITPLRRGTKGSGTQLSGESRRGEVDGSCDDDDDDDKKSREIERGEAERGRGE